MVEEKRWGTRPQDEAYLEDIQAYEDALEEGEVEDFDEWEDKKGD